MAEKKQKKVDIAPVPQENNQGEKPGGIWHSIAVILLALLIVAVVTIGVFCFAVKKNINGLAESVGPQIKNNPVLKHILPAELRTVNPDDPQFLTEKELLKRYEECRKRTAELEELLNQANETIEQMQQQSKEYADAKAVLAENQTALETIALERAKLAADEKALSVLIAKGDTQGFREYFEKVDKATAEAIYEEIITEDITSEEKLKLAQPFSSMEPNNAAGILSALFKKDQNTLLDIFEGLKSSKAALILEQMDAETAAEITNLLSNRKQVR